MRLDFVKMHGLGNDFILFDRPTSPPDARTLRRLSDRRTGIGFDQALMLEPPRTPDSEIYYRIYNSDGSEVEQCGNGARCVAALIARRKGIVSGEIAMDSLGGKVLARVRDDGLVSVRMGVPDFDPRSLPFEVAVQADEYTLQINEEETLRIGAVSIGNPHIVIRVEDVTRAPVDRLGPAVENHPRFPRRTNVGFMQVLSPGHIRLRVHERGVGETRACGTGACAAAAVGARWAILQEKVQVDLPGGSLQIEWAGDDAPIWLTGPAVTVYHGQIEL